MKALVVFASLTGNTREAADVVVEALEDRGVEAELVDGMTVYGDEFLDVDICMLGTYTYGENLPNELVDLYDDMEDLDLTGKVFGVFGSGDHEYENFCGSVDDFYKQFEKTGATPAGPPVKFELSVGKEDIEALENLADQAVKLAKEKASE